MLINFKMIKKLSQNGKKSAKYKNELKIIVPNFHMI